jgi:hypothetical protein
MEMSRRYKTFFPSNTNMKKACALLTLFASLAVRHAVAQNGTVNIPLGALQAAYRSSFGSDPDLGQYGQLALSINRARSQYFPQSAGGFWNGTVNADPGGDHGKDTYTIVTIAPGSFPQNPDGVPLRDLRAVFGGALGRLPDLDDYADVALAIHRWYRSQNMQCAGGFWNGEQSIIHSHDTFGVVWVTSPNASQNIPAAQLAASFQSRTQRAPDFSVYADMAFAVTCWIADNQPGQALGGFWNGERSGSGPGLAYTIILVR